MHGGSLIFTLIQRVYSCRTSGIIRVLSVLHSYSVVLVINARKLAQRQNRCPCPPQSYNNATLESQPESIVDIIYKDVGSNNGVEGGILNAACTRQTLNDQYFLTSALWEEINSFCVIQGLCEERRMTNCVIDEDRNPTTAAAVPYLP